MGSLLCSVQLLSFNNCCTSIIMRWFLVVLCIQATFASRVKRGGSCETTDDCVAPNVCSKWGWCQWTKIYGEEGPSQGASAPGAGRAGQCVTSADCASRVPYCSKLGYCHGGRLPFDEAQLEIVGDEEAQGFINNNPPKNSPISQSKSSSGSNNNAGATGRAGRRNSNRNRSQNRVPGSSGAAARPRTAAQRTKSSTGKGRGNNQRKQASRGGQCPGGTLEKCIETG